MSRALEGLVFWEDSMLADLCATLEVEITYNIPGRGRLILLIRLLHRTIAWSHVKLTRHAPQLVSRSTTEKSQYRLHSTRGVAKHSTRTNRPTEALSVRQPTP